MKTLKGIFIFSLLFIISCDKSTNPIDPSSTWILQRGKQDNITYYSIHFSDQNIGWICGYDGTIKNTTDGGNTWLSQQSGVSENFWDISFANNLEGWICGANNTILKTTDGGKTQNNILPSDSLNKTYVSIKFTDGNNGWTSNNHGEILHTLNGGQSWKIKMTGLLGGARLSVIDQQTVYVLNGKLYRTFNSGATWDIAEVSVPKNYKAVNMFFINNNRGWIVTGNGTGGTILTEFPILTTNDGGLSWHVTDYLLDGESPGFRCVHFANENVGWIAGYQNVYKTTDAGKSWIKENSSGNNKLGTKDISFVDGNNGWIINYEGEIYKYQIASRW